MGNYPKLAGRHDYRRDGYFERKIVDGNIVCSREACIFLNEVKSIIRIIGQNSLKPDEVTILCEHTRTLHPIKILNFSGDFRAYKFSSFRLLTPPIHKCTSSPFIILLMERI